MTEHQHQCALFCWAAIEAGRHPELDLMFAVPNAGKRTPRQGAWMKAEGLRAGVPDILLDVPKNGYHGLRIELKVPKAGKRAKGRVSPDQAVWIERLKSYGYRAEICYGWEDAKRLIEEYLGQEQ